MPVRAVVFDAFGTLCELRADRRPFVKLARKSPRARETLHAVLTRPLGLAEAAAEFVPDETDIESLVGDLQADLAQMALFADVLPCLARLERSGTKIGIASNLAMPYARPLIDLLPAGLSFAWSFEVGHLKPAPQVFESILKALDVAPNEALMVGDNLLADYQGAEAFGMKALHLVRDGRAPEAVRTIRTLTDVQEHLHDG